MRIQRKYQLIVNYQLKSIKSWMHNWAINNRILNNKEESQKESLTIQDLDMETKENNISKDQYSGLKDGEEALW